ncbi:TonB-dependent receptor plug domain-containing protein [Hyphococcus sp. DH-69]|uniref:TonB-dependent receptor plug domain-containing protein n=1 Tax=Hyphococcus formosus TaxID=3143534 RepID=UPI00398B60F8
MVSKNRAGRLLCTTILASTLFATTAPVMAQSDEASDDTIIVTGSRIARSDLEAPTATTIVDAALIDLSGAVNTADLLRSLPVFGISGLSSTNSNFLVANGGINTLELRNLGEDRTLVLVNGRRVVGGVPGSANVDFNQIPTEMIERIDVVTGGASAIYGSDALAGVVNVILKDDFEGVSASFQGGTTWLGGGENYRANLLVGGNFADGRGNATINFTYSDNKGLRANQRDNLLLDDLALCYFEGGLDECAEVQEPVFSSFSEQGRFNLSDGSITVRPDGSVVDFDGVIDGFNRQAFRRVSVPVERFLLSTNTHYEITDNVRVFFEGTYANSRTATAIEPFPFDVADAFGGDPNRGIPFSNPFVQNTPGFAAAVIAANGGVAPAEIPFVRRLTEIDARGASADRDTLRFVVGLDGTIFDDYSWEVSYNRGVSTSTQISTGQINVANLREALNATEVGGEIVCANPIAVAEGCVPFNPIGAGSISPEAAAYVRADGVRVAENLQQVISGSITGPLFELPAGSANFALGGEYREESSFDVPDALSQSGQNGGNVSPITEGEFNVYEFFGELNIPLIKDAAFAKDVSIGGAYRFSDYSLSGITHAYSADARWAVNDLVALRFQYAKAVRAPNIGELFQPNSETFATVTDVCNGVTATTPGIVAENCRLEPTVAARIAATGSFTLTQPEIQGTGGFIGGNPNLAPETAKTYQAGMIFTPDFGEWGNLVLTADYFNISIDGVVAAPGRQFTIDQCYNSVNLSSPFCDSLVRQDQGTAAQNGALLEVNTLLANAGTRKTSGLDFFVTYNLDLADHISAPDVWFGGDAGSLALRANYTRLFKYESVILEAFTDGKGTLGIPVNEAQASLLYSVGPMSFMWESTMFSSTVNDNDEGSFFFGFPHDGAVYHDLQLRYEIVAETLEMTFGIDNVFGKEPANVFTGVPGNTTGTDTAADVYDPFGRRVYAGVRLTF